MTSKPRADHIIENKDWVACFIAKVITKSGKCRIASLSGEEARIVDKNHASFVPETKYVMDLLFYRAVQGGAGRIARTIMSVEPIDGGFVQLRKYPRQTLPAVALNYLDMRIAVKVFGSSCSQRG